MNDNYDITDPIFILMRKERIGNNHSGKKNIIEEIEMISQIKSIQKTKQPNWINENKL